MEMKYRLLLLPFLCSSILTLSKAQDRTMAEQNGELIFNANLDDYYDEEYGTYDEPEPGDYEPEPEPGDYEPEPEPGDYDPIPEKDPCADLTGRDKILCKRKQVLTDYEESSNPCADLTGRERGMCERDRNREERNRGSPDGTDSERENPCAGLRGRRRGMCEKNRNKDANGGSDPCEGLRGPKKRKCKRKQRSNGDDGIEELPDPNAEGPKETIIHQPLGTDRIRFAGNSTFYNGGLVNIFRNNSWGYVCDDDWDIKDADVACRQLGYARGAVEAKSSSFYGEAEDNAYLMDDVKCSGDEKQLQKCKYNREHDCEKNEAAGIICHLNTGCPNKWIAGPTGCYRLFSGSITRYTAEVKCKSIDGHLVKIETKEENDFLSSILRIRTNKHYWLTDGTKKADWVWKSDNMPISTPFWFPGWEPQSQFPKPSNNLLARCVALANAFQHDRPKYLTDYFYWDNVNCNRVSDFICETEKTTQATKTPCYSGDGADYRGDKSETSKGTPCAKWTRSRKINPSTHPDAGLGDHNYCRNPDGDSRPWCWVSTRGNLFGYCDIPKCPTDVQPTSTETPTTTAKATTTPAHVTTTAVEDSINCPKDEMFCPSSDSCIALSWKCDKENDCPDGEDERNCDYKLPLFEKQDHRFTIRSDPVEVYMSMPLETCARTCVNHRKFACKAFYYDTPLNQCSLYDTNDGSASYFPQSGKYYVLKESCGETDFHCGNGKCVAKDKICNQYNDCGDFSDEAECGKPESIEVRLVDGNDEHSGRVEIKYLNEWGIICDDEWDLKDATVVCRMLGYPTAAASFLPYTISDGDRNFLLSNVKCTGNETNLLQCKRDKWGQHECKAHEVVGIDCQSDKVCSSDKFACATSKKCIPLSYLCDGEDDCPDSSDEKKCSIKVELVGGKNDLIGRLQITRGGVKGSVCDDDFDNRDATVFCRTMGHSSGRVIENNFGASDGAIWLDDVTCDGSEYNIKDCHARGWGEHDCTHEEDVAIKCFAESDVTVKPTTTRKPPGKPTVQNDVVCGKRPRAPQTAPRTRRDERTVAKPHLSRIVGGTSTLYGNYPWQVGVRIVNLIHFDGSRSSSHHCGATVLSEFWVISAAHCFALSVKKDNILLRTGDLNGKVYDAHEQSFEVQTVIRHPRYDSHTYDYDIALLKLKPDRNGNGIKFNDFVQPACLPPDNLRNSPGTRCEISGWGSTGQSYPSKLKAATVPLLSKRICNTVYKDITPRMMCAGYLEGGIDTCQGDSGGPLVCDIDGVHTLVGITSWGHGCAQPNYPGVYTNVTYLKPWVESTMAKYS